MGDISKRVLNESNFSDEKVRAAAVRELGLQSLSVDDQNEIMEIMREAITTRIDAAILKALGSAGVRALGVVPDGDDQQFSKALSDALPNIGEIVKNAIAESVASYQKSAASMLK